MPMEVPGRDKATSRSLTPRARELRHSDTLAEKLAWRLLRNRQLLHYKSRRQLPLDSAIVDFCCLSLKLVIELDGAGHAYALQAKRDRQRDRELEERGYRVLRVPNGMVLKAPAEFVKRFESASPSWSSSVERAASIKTDMRSPSPPTPLARWGEGSGDYRLGKRSLMVSLAPQP